MVISTWFQVPSCIHPSDSVHPSNLFQYSTVQGTERSQEKEGATEHDSTEKERKVKGFLAKYKFDKKTCKQITDARI